MAPEIIAVEPANCPSMTKGEYRYDFGDAMGMTPLMKMHTLGHGFVPSAIHAGGLRYHGMRCAGRLVLNVHGRCVSAVAMVMWYYPPPVLTWACPNTATPCFRTSGYCEDPSFLRFQSNRKCGLQLCAGCGKGPHGCLRVGVAVVPCALVFWGVCWPVALYCHVLWGWAGLCLQHVFRGTWCAVTQARPYMATLCVRTCAPRNTTRPVLGQGGGYL